MIDRVVHHADVLTLKGASYRLRNRGIDTLPSIKTQDTTDQNSTKGLNFEHCRHAVRLNPGVSHEDGRAGHAPVPDSLGERARRHRRAESAGRIGEWPS